MADTEWFERRPGDLASQGTDDPSLVLVGDGVPDWVRLPAELGGGQVKVLGHHTAPCPMCKSQHPVRHLRLKRGYGVAECGRCGFVWYQQPEASP